MGYLLPWGQMSYWGAQVIVNLFGTIPWVGPELAIWIRGDYVVSDATLNRFFALHVVAVPIVLLGCCFCQFIGLTFNKGIEAEFTVQVVFHRFVPAAVAIGTQGLWMGHLAN